jgi:adenylate cyclase
MADGLRIIVYDRDRPPFDKCFDGPVELGRQRDSREDFFTATLLENGRHRLVIARPNEDKTSRWHAQLEPLPGNRARLHNVSGTAPVVLPDGHEVGPGGTRELDLPLDLLLGERRVRVEPWSLSENISNRLPDPIAPPDASSITASRFPTLGLGSSNEIHLRPLMKWLQTTMAVLQAAASSSDFFQRAAQAVVDIVGLHTGRVLLLENGRWELVATRAARNVPLKQDWQPSRTVLNRVREEKRTIWLVPSLNPDLTKSLRGVEFVVASPILDRSGGVIGALYGDCYCEGTAAVAIQRITPLEAMLVELIASGVATGLARLEQEKNAIEMDVRFSQFFTKELARQLALNPDLLQGRDCEVSILFCDVRSFSRISEALGPAGTVEWIGEVMGVLSDCVLAHGGVLVDYIGDELMAMWGAPEEQPDHARRACRAALDMLAALPGLNEKWQPRLNEPLDLGIGINTGVARVGNTGSRHKFKYGPLGPSVNLASRVQGATKYLRSQLLITEFTRSQLDDTFNWRRLSKVRVVNIDRPVDLYEVVPSNRPGWAEVKEAYEQALVEFEQGHFRPAARLVAPLVAEHREDGPALVLMLRIVRALVEQSTTFDPTWELPGK